jgi:undecaprenyl diphosphate synthase
VDTAIPVVPVTERAGSVPQHVAIIMDGNGRWAKLRGSPRTVGHRAGVKSVRGVVDECLRRGIKTLTIFAFSSENWRRPRTEVTVLIELFMVVLRSEVRRMNDNGVRLRVIGERSAFSDKLQQRIAEAEQLTATNTALTLQVAANYGGRWDITQALRRLLTEVQAGRLIPDLIDETTLAAYLSFPDVSDPDLFIRTGGEQRLSNFVLWQSAYAELYFTDILWPDFDEVAFGAAVDDFAQRQRRFGHTGEQIETWVTLNARR